MATTTNPFFKGMTKEECAAKYSHKTFGSWTTGDIELHGSTWYTTVNCSECGSEFRVSIMCLSKHNRCNCIKYLREREIVTAPSGFVALEKIWPKVVKAGQRIMRKHKNAMASI